MTLPDPPPPSSSDPTGATAGTGTAPDTAQALHSLYTASGGVGQVFSAKARDYQRARPDYPAALFAHLATHAGLGPGARVLDLGAGTGLLTQGLLAAGAQVLAVEPADEMRAVADAVLGHLPGYSSAPGRAEALPVPDGAVDLITAAQAFHWFDVPRARAEARRALRQGGQVALITNERVAEDPLHQALDEGFARFGGERRDALVAHEAQKATQGMAAFFDDAGFAQAEWPHGHALDEAGLQALVFSRSYMPLRGTAEGEAAAAWVARVFARFAQGGRVQVRYRTQCCQGRPGG